MPAELAPLHEPGERVVQCEIAAADRRRAGAAVGLQHVAVDDDLPLAQHDDVAHAPQRPADEPLDLLVRPPCLPRTASSTRSGDEPGSIEYSAVTQPGPAPQPAGHVLVDGDGAQHPGAAEGDEHRAAAIS